MAPKKPNPMQELPAASSSEDEEISSDEVTSSDDEQTEEPTKPSSPPPQQTQKPTHSVASAPHSKSSSSEEDSESESDSDSESTPKPIANTKSMKETPKATTTKPRSKAPAKRPNETEESLKDSKRAKKKETGADPDDEDQKKPGEDTKKQLFQRVWSEEHEIAVLKGLIDFTTKKGMDPYQDTNAFHDFIKKSLHVEFTRTQVMEKIRRLKKKYENNLGKKGEDKTFSKLHEQQAYDLSKKLWGNGSTTGVLESAAKSNGKAKKNQNLKGSSESLAFCKAELNDGAKEGEQMDIDNDKKGSLFNKSVGMAGFEEFVINQGLDMIGGAKKAELEERWEKLQIALLQLFMERNDLIKEQTELVLEAMKSSGH